MFEGSAASRAIASSDCILVASLQSVQIGLHRPKTMQVKCELIGNDQGQSNLR